MKTMGESLTVAAQERYRLGEVTSATPLLPESFDISGDLAPAAIYSVEVTDPYIAAADPEKVAAVQAFEGFIDAFAGNRREQGLWQRETETVYVDSNGDEVEKGPNEWGDPLARQLFFDHLNSPAAEAWQGIVPSANALTPFYDPYSTKVITKKDGTLVPVDDTARDWFVAATDSFVDRARGSVMSAIIKEYVADPDNVDRKHTWMSVACGTALPVMKAAQHIGIDPKMLLLDIDRGSMSETTRLAAEIGYNTDNVVSLRKNIFKADAVAKLTETLIENNERPNIMDLIGIFEYVGKYLNIDPAVFLKSYYDALAPGGVMVLGQMRDDRPHPDFAMGVVGWPCIVMRSPKEVMEIIKRAGIDTKEAKLYLPTDGVYTLCSINKPSAAVEVSKLQSLDRKGTLGIALSQSAIHGALAV